MATNDPKIELSRRETLAALGTIGVASAGAGLGTSAYFSDEESFDGNQLTAGALDLKVDWEEHYHLTNEQVEVDTEDGPVDGVLMSDPGDPNYVGFPDPADPMVWVHVDAIDEYMDLTSIEAFPDADDDGIQDDLTQYDACEDFADTPGDLDPTDPTQADALRTFNEDTWNGDTYNPLVNLDDVKPGDFGELTLSFHLCDNPGYVWMNGELVDASENGLTEPEAKDPDEEEGVVELLDEVRTMLWYDEDGDNVYEPSGVSGEVDVVLVLDESGSMEGQKMEDMKDGANGLIDALTLGPDAAQVGVVSFQDGGSTPATLRQGLTTSAADAKAGVDSIPNDAAGRTNMEAGVEAGQEELTGDDSIIGSFTPSGNDRDSAEKIMVFLGDGAPNEGTDTDANEDPVEEATTAKDAGIEIYTIGYDVGAGSTAADILESMASSPVDEYAYLGDSTEIEQIFAQISQIIAGEERFFEGTLRELLDALGEGQGIPLDGDRTTPFDELDDDPTDDARECFVDSTTNAVGLAWWLPVDHANEIQTDSVSFDLGFYTEQCRHNDGSGIPDRDVTTTTGDGFAKEGESYAQPVSGSARARNGDNGNTSIGDSARTEVLVGTGDLGQSANVDDQVSHDWGAAGDPGPAYTESTSFTYSYDDGPGEATFQIDGETVNSDAFTPVGRLAVQGKADEADVAISNVALTVDGTPQTLNGPSGVTASNDGSGRSVQYLALDTALDGSQSFTLTGDIDVETQSDFGGGNEDWAFDVVVE